MSTKPMSKRYLKAFLAAAAIGSACGGGGGGGCGENPEQLCFDCEYDVSVCRLPNGSETKPDCTSVIQTFCGPQYGGSVVDITEEYCAVAGTDDVGDEASGGGAGPGDGLDETAAEAEWDPSDIEEDSEEGHYTVPGGYVAYALANPFATVSGEGTVAFLESDGCVRVDVAGDVAEALGVSSGDTLLRMNRLGLSEADASATLTSLMNETDLVLEVEGSTARAWFVRPRRLRYLIE